MALTPADVRALDGNAEALGVPVAGLMEAAGRAVADEIGRRWAEGSVVVVAGLGNNGGDGLVAARHLRAAGRRVKVLLAGRSEDVKTDLARDALQAAEDAGVPVVSFSDVLLEELLDDADIVVDALLGVGVAGALRSPMDRIVAAVDAHEAPVVAVDLPTGHGGDLSIDAVVTVTFHDVKEGMDERVCGDIVVADIGIPADAETYVGPGDVWARYPRTPTGAHKGDMGRVLIVGGGPYTGAPSLAALGAFGVGTDLVHLACPGAAGEVAERRILEAIVDRLEGDRFVLAHVDRIVSGWKPVDVVLVGPGLGRHEETLAAVRALVEQAVGAGKGVVLDADALHAFEGRDDWLAKQRVIVTPHAGELRALSGLDVRDADMDERLETVQGWVGDGDAVVLLKGEEDLIVARDRARRNRMHDPAMTTGGTGDVLAGATAALWGRGMDPFEAACLAAYLVGAAGVEAVKEVGPALRAGHVADTLPGIVAGMTRTAQESMS